MSRSSPYIVPTGMDILEQLRAALGSGYDVERPLGTGGMGTVYLGRDRTLDRAVAIKVINPDFGTSGAVRDRFLQEARTIARLQHPHIVSVFQAGETGGLLYFVMEYVPGESLRDLLDRERRVPSDRARQILRDLAGALAYAHHHGVVHRDIKPENVLLREGTGEAKLADFGVARALSADGDSRLTGTGMVVGTPRYMSPEQASGERVLDGRSDIYSLGLIGYEMFAGEPAFTGDTPASVIVKQVTTPPPPLHDRAADVPADVEAVIEKAIEKSPADRWQDAAEMARALAGEEMLVARATGSSRAARRRRWLLWSGIAAAGLAIIAALSVWMTARSGVPEGVDPRKSFFVVPFENQTGDPTLAWLREGSMNMLTLNLASWRDLKVVDYERALDLLKADGFDGAGRIGLDQARGVARRAGAWTLVMGQIARTADSLVVTARVYDVARGDPLQRATVVSAPVGTDPRPLFDRVSRELLDIAGAPAMSPELARTTSWSLGAYKAYLAGVTALNEVMLDSAERALAAAIAADSTFALAWYKRAIGAGWRPIPGDSTPLHYSRLAARFAGRLPARERRLIQGHLALSEGIAGNQRGDAAGARAHLVEARRIFGELVTADSLHAEAWYGLGDAWYHDPGGGPPRALSYTRALRAFQRTLAIDSTAHLAYPHTIELYTLAAASQSPYVLLGDSVAFVNPRERAAFGEARISEARMNARQLGVREAERWVAADPDSPEAYDRLGTAYSAVGDTRRAADAIRRALQRPTTRRPEHAYRLAALEMATGDTGALETLRRARREVPADSLRRTSFQRVPTVLGAAAVASHHGRFAEMQETFAVIERTDPYPLPSARAVRMSQLTKTFEMLHRAAMGTAFAEVKPRIDATIRAMEAYDARQSPEMAGMRQLVPYFAWIVSGDSTYGTILRRWIGDTALVPALPPFVRAMNALQRGDTAAARAASRDFARADTSKLNPYGQGMFQSFLEAEVLADLGDARGAIASYDAINPAHFTTFGYPDIRWPLYSRSFLARGRLHEQLGARDAAVRSYERFLELWGDADPEFQREGRLAREALARLRDAPLPGR